LSLRLYINDVPGMKSRANKDNPPGDYKISWFFSPVFGIHLPIPESGFQHPQQKGIKLTPFPSFAQPWFIVFSDESCFFNCLCPCAVIKTFSSTWMAKRFTVGGCPRPRQTKYLSFCTFMETLVLVRFCLIILYLAALVLVRMNFLILQATSVIGWI
jgi:hypothetical protein